jgi:hypothetical protein
MSSALKTSPLRLCGRQGREANSTTCLCPLATHNNDGWISRPAQLAASIPLAEGLKPTIKHFASLICNKSAQTTSPGRGSMEGSLRLEV